MSNGADRTPAICTSSTALRLVLLGRDCCRVTRIRLRLGGARFFLSQPLEIDSGAFKAKACLSASRLPLELELAESNIGNIGGAFDIGEPADRLIQHNGNGGYFRDTGVRVPIVGMAWLFKQLDAGGIEGRGKAAGVGLP